MKSSLNQSPSKRLGTSGRLGSPTLLPDLFVSDHTDAIGCSRLLQSDTGSREKRKDVPTMAKQSKRSWTLLFLLFLFYVNLFFLVGPASFFAIPQEFDICN